MYLQELFMKIYAEHNHTGHDHTKHDATEHNHDEHEHSTNPALSEHTDSNIIDVHAGHNHGPSTTTDDTWATFIDSFIHMAIEFTFIFLAMTILTSLVLSYIPRKKIEALFGAPRGGGYFVALCLAACTPLCNISGIPLFQGLLHAKAKFGPCMTFLLASPLISPLIGALLYTTFGAAFTFFYILLAAFFAIFTGALFQFLNFEQFVYTAKTLDIKYQCCEEEQTSSSPTHFEKCAHTSVQASSHIRKLRDAVLKGLYNFKIAAPYLFLGIILSALVFSFAPEKFLITYMHDDSIITIIISTLIGLPLHVHPESFIPATKVLLQKGMGLGVAMAFLLSSVVISITSITLLKPLFSFPLLLSITIGAFLYAILGGMLFPIFF